MVLSDVPQLHALFEEADGEMTKMEAFLEEIERRLTDCLRREDFPPADLTQAIATAKVKAVELAIELCWRLKQEVGSFALMSGSGFEQLDYLQCCKFAEGDSRILMHKISRDRMQAFQKGFEGPAKEADLCKRILEAGKTGDKDGEFLKAYELAEAVMQRTMESFHAPAAKL